MQLGFPPIIIRDKEKTIYYEGFKEYREKRKNITMEKVLTLALLESFHKRITYLKGDSAIRLSEYAQNTNQLLKALLNKAKRQTIPAFREKGVWKISE
mgnify:FL=1